MYYNQYMSCILSKTTKILLDFDAVQTEFPHYEHVPLNEEECNQEVADECHRCVWCCATSTDCIYTLAWGCTTLWKSVASENTVSRWKWLFIVLSYTSCVANSTSQTGKYSNASYLRSNWRHTGFQKIHNHLHYLLHFRYDVVTTACV